MMLSFYKLLQDGADLLYDGLMESAFITMLG